MRFSRSTIAVAVGTEDELRAQGRRHLFRLAALLLAVLLGRHAWITTLAEGEVKEDYPISQFVLLEEERTGGDLHIARVGADREEGSGLSCARAVLGAHRFGDKRDREQRDRDSRT